MWPLVALLFGYFCGTCQCTWQRSSILDLDGSVRMSWNVTKGESGDLLDVEVTAPTQGYLGLGFSWNGAMRGSDIVLGWVDDSGKGHLRDFHGIGNEMPVLDASQDYKLISAEQQGGKTTVRFRRPLRTCDKDDLEITNDTMRIIWAYENRDPEIVGDNVYFHWHGPGHRGAKSVYLLDSPLLAAPFPDDNSDPSVKYWDIMLDEITVEGEESLYFCKIVKLPKLEKKHHMIGYRPLIQNVKNVHHMCMYECTVPESMGGTAATFEKHLEHPGGRCYTKNMPPEWGAFCGGFFQCWVAGGEGEMFPEHVGATMGEEHGGTTYFMFEVHYDNPEKGTFTDASGIRLYYTDKLREYEGGILLASYRVSPFMLIPPKQTDFHIYGFCSSECTRKALPEEGIKIFGVLLHAHLAGRRIKLRHFRNGKELPLITEDKAYDFNYQNTRFLKNEVTVLPGDELLTECEFETMDRNRSVLGGLSTREEMCQSFIMYYPKQPLFECSSQYEFHDFFQSLGIKDVRGKVFSALNLPYNPNLWPKEKQQFDPPDNGRELESILEGRTDVYDLMEMGPEGQNAETVGDYLQKQDWLNRTASKAIENGWKDGKHYAYCTMKGRRRIPLNDYITSLPRGMPEAQAQDNFCEVQRFKSASSASQLLPNLIAVLLAIAFMHRQLP